MSAHRLAFPDLTRLAAQLTADGYLIGSVSALALVTGQPVNLGGWQPGDTETAQAQAVTAGAAGLTGGLPGAGQEYGAWIAGTYLNAMGRALATGLDAGLTIDALATALGGVLADAGIATALALNVLTATSATAAQTVYTAHQVASGRWITDPGPPPPCPACVANEAAGPVPIGAPYPSGDITTPAHPNCRCAVVPA